MTTPAKPGWDTPQRIQRNRIAKAHRFIRHFLAKMREAGVPEPEKSADALREALAIVRAATSEQWAQVARHLTEDYRRAGSVKVEEPPSGSTFELIVSELESMIRRAETAKDQLERDLDEVMEGLHEARRAHLEERGLLEEDR